MCEYYRNISEDEKIPKTNYPNTKNKNTSDIDRERTRGWCKPRHLHFKPTNFKGNLWKEVAHCM